MKHAIVALVVLLQISCDAEYRPHGDLPSQGGGRGLTEPSPTPEPMTPPAPEPKDNEIRLEVVMMGQWEGPMAFDLVMTTMKENCADAGCHNNDMMIDFRNFPFQVSEASSMMPDVDPRLEGEARQTAIQVALLDASIDAAQIGYMPLGGPNLSEKQIQGYRNWKEENLATSRPELKLTLTVVGIDEKKNEVCSQNWAVDKLAAMVSFTSKECAAAIELVATLKNEEGLQLQTNRFALEEEKTDYKLEMDFEL